MLPWLELASSELAQNGWETHSILPEYTGTNVAIPLALRASS